MGHASRRWVVLWLLVALLPLRGWALATMHLPAPAAVPPCHAAAQDDAAAHDAACALCDVCHGAMLAPAWAPAAASAPGAQTPVSAAPGAPPVRVAEAPFRPPRC